jgi:DNA replication protein DnaC
MTPEENNREANEIWLRERRQRLVDNLLGRRPAAFAAPGDLDPELRAWARMLAGGAGRNLILTGPVGAGKTWAVWKAAEEAVRSGYEGSVIVASAAKLRRAVAPATADPAWFARCCDAGLLAIDDLGAFGLSEWDLDHLAELADARWAAQVPTVVTSNTTDLQGLLGPRISSRLADGALVFEMDGPDRRRQP